MKKRHILTKAEAAAMEDIDVECYRQLEDLTNELVDEFVLEREMTTSEIAATANLSPATVARLMNYETRFPRYITVAKLATAAGWRLSINRQKIKLVRKAIPKRRKAA